MLRNESYRSFPSSAHRERVLAAALASKAPARGRVRWRHALWWAGAFALMLALTSVAGVDLGARTPALVWATLFGWLVVAVAGTRLLIARRGSMIGAPKHHLAIGALALPLVLLGWKLAWSAVHPAAPIAGDALSCLMLGLGLGAGPLAAALATRAGSDPLHPRLTGLALGVASGAWAWLFLDVTCPSAEPLHLVAGHVAPLVLSGVAGALLGPPILSLRAR